MHTDDHGRPGNSSVSGPHSRFLTAPPPLSHTPHPRRSTLASASTLHTGKASRARVAAHHASGPHGPGPRASYLSTRGRSRSRAARAPARLPTADARERAPHPSARAGHAAGETGCDSIRAARRCTSRSRTRLPTSPRPAPRASSTSSPPSPLRGRRPPRLR